MTGSDGHLLSRDNTHHSRIMIQNYQMWTNNGSIPMQKYANGTTYGLQNISHSVNNNVPSIMAHTGHISALSVEKQCIVMPMARDQLSTQSVQVFPQLQQVPLALQQFQPSQQQCQPSQQLFQPGQQLHPSRQQSQSSVQRFQSFPKQSSNQYLQSMPSQLQPARPQLQNPRMQFQPYQHQVQQSTRPIHGPVQTNKQVYNGHQPSSKEVSTSGSSITRQLLMARRTDKSQSGDVSKTIYQQPYTSLSHQGNFQHENNGYPIRKDLQNFTNLAPTAPSAKSNGNENNINENQFGSPSTYNQNVSAQPMEDILNGIIFSGMS